MHEAYSRASRSAAELKPASRESRRTSVRNHISIFFSIVQRKVLTPAAAHDIPHLRERILGFEAQYRAHPRPFAWRFTRTDFRKRLRELAA